MIKKIVLWYLRKISLEQCAIHNCEDCPFGGGKELICSIIKVIQALRKL